ncbi:MAG TPA: Ig-like domain-containing protein [Thermoanaerobaculia bacterium]|nr:Ig-like domain-containing protein [Thermoanaerobaculia bacterium]
MRRKILLTTIGAVLLAALPAAAAPPFGSFGGIVGGGNAGAGVIPLFGWALDDNGVDSVDVFVDGVIAGRAAYGRARPGVAARFPTFPDAKAAGFSYGLDTTHYLNGLHTVSVRVKSKTGEFAFLNPRTFQFHNVTHNLAPFGRIEFPNENAELRGHCDLANPARRYSVVSGYALDAGVQADDHGVGYVELLIDGAEFANSKTDCFFSNLTGGLSNCYGLRRVDIQPFFPSLKDSPQSGFRFVLDIGLLMAFGFTPGHHLLTVRASDFNGQVANIDSIPVSFICDEDLGNEDAFGLIGGPLNGQQYSGIMTAHGWALDINGVSRLDFYVDGVFVGSTTLTLVRPAVSSLYPGYPDSAVPGWVFAVDTTKIANGEHRLQVIVVDDVGGTTLLGERRFVVVNPGN